MIIKNYDRIKAVNYARSWALSRNPIYYNFDKLGGDCTNFVSQCLFNGSNIMNYNYNTGWYYISLNKRSPSWTGVEFLYNFLINNKDTGPFGALVSKDKINIGDIVQLGDNKNNYYHAAIVSNIINEQIYVCAHTVDSKDRPLNSYTYFNIRLIHIGGIRN